MGAGVAGGVGGMGGVGGVGLVGLGGRADSPGPGRCASERTLMSALAAVGPWSSATDRTLGSSPTCCTEETAEGSAMGDTVFSITALSIMRGDGQTLPGTGW